MDRGDGRSVVIVLGLLRLGLLDGLLVIVFIRGLFLALRCRLFIVYPRRFGFFSRKGICAVSVPAFPQGALDDLEGAHAVFSMFSDDAVPGGVAAAQQAAAAAEDQPTAVSSKEYFFVEGWLSYDITGLSDATPNEAPAGPRLSPSEQNSRYRAVDLAVGRRGVVQDYISPPALMRGVAQRVFQRVKLLT